jgi:hypothetical protein
LEEGQVLGDLEFDLRARLCCAGRAGNGCQRKTRRVCPTCRNVRSCQECDMCDNCYYVQDNSNNAP